MYVYMYKIYYIYFWRMYNFITFSHCLWLIELFLDEDHSCKINCSYRKLMITAINHIIIRCKLMDCLNLSLPSAYSEILKMLKKKFDLFKIEWIEVRDITFVTAYISIVRKEILQNITIYFKFKNNAIFD